MKEKMSEIMKAMKLFGYPEGAVRLQMLDADRAEVFYRDGNFGIYDFVKHTFVN